MKTWRTVIQPTIAQRLVYIQCAILLVALITLYRPIWSMILMLVLGVFQIGFSLVLLSYRGRMVKGLKYRLLGYHLGVAAYIPCYIIVINVMKITRGNLFWTYLSLAVIPALALCALMIWLTDASGKEEWSEPTSVELPNILDA